LYFFSSSGSSPSPPVPATDFPSLSPDTFALASAFSLASSAKRIALARFLDHLTTAGNLFFKKVRLLIQNG